MAQVANQPQTKKRQPQVGNRLKVKTLAKSTRLPGYYADGRGLYLRVSTPNRASWLFRYERHGREHWMGLGALDHDGDLRSNSTKRVKKQATRGDC